MPTCPCIACTNGLGGQVRIVLKRNRPVKSRSAHELICPKDEVAGPKFVDRCRFSDPLRADNSFERDHGADAVYDVFIVRPWC
jgi:hypothetical protein